VLVFPRAAPLPPPDVDSVASQWPITPADGEAPMLYGSRHIFEKIVSRLLATAEKGHVDPQVCYPIASSSGT